ncbi:hypothetical protein KAR91_60430 [Candidatus Pacearchaeota archaeon]|nr:hypothetical protein [Candidatus Pacearchaeota archaeon]
MGTPTPPPPTIGNPCAGCDGILWPVGETPRFVQILAALLEKCPGCPIDAPNGLWWLEQDPGDNCTWRYEDSLYKMILFGAGAGKQVRITDTADPLQWWFFDTLGGVCPYDFVNLFVACNPTVGSKNGTIHVYWPGP